MSTASAEPEPTAPVRRPDASELTDTVDRRERGSREQKDR
jgi:hypothetical protein